MKIIDSVVEKTPHRHDVITKVTHPTPPQASQIRYPETPTPTRFLRAAHASSVLESSHYSGQGLWQLQPTPSCQTPDAKRVFHKADPRAPSTICKVRRRKHASGAFVERMVGLEPTTLLHGKCGQRLRPFAPVR